MQKGKSRKIRIPTIGRVDPTQRARKEVPHYVVLYPWRILSGGSSRFVQDIKNITIEGEKWGDLMW